MQLCRQGNGCSGRAGEEVHAAARPRTPIFGCAHGHGASHAPAAAAAAPAQPQQHEPSHGWHKFTHSTPSLSSICKLQRRKQAERQPKQKSCAQHSSKSSPPSPQREDRGGLLFFSSFFFLHVHRLFTVHIAISFFPLPSPFRWVQKILLASGSAERVFLPPFLWGSWQMATEKPNSNPIAAGKHKSSGSKRG